MDLSEYLDAAARATGLKSDRALSTRLGLSPQAVFHFRHARALPADETMIRLAGLAGVDPARALLDLNIWRAGMSSPAGAVYRDILKRIAVLLLVITTFCVSSMETQAEQTDINSRQHCILSKIKKYILWLWFTARSWLCREHRPGAWGRTWIAYWT